MFKLSLNGGEMFLLYLADDCDLVVGLDAPLPPRVPLPLVPESLNLLLFSKYINSLLLNLKQQSQLILQILMLSFIDAEWVVCNHQRVKRTKVPSRVAARRHLRPLTPGYRLKRTDSCST